MRPLWTKALGEHSGSARSIVRFSRRDYALSGLDSYHPDPELTDVFREGDPQYQRSLGEFLFPDVDVGAPYIRIPVHGGGEQYLRHNTERGLRSKHTEIGDTVSTRTFGYSRFGVKAGLDFLEMEFAEPAFRRREFLVLLLREALRVDQEVIRYDLLADANFPAGHVINLAGSEWNQPGGDSAGDLEAGLDVLRLAYPWVQPEHVELAITFTAKRALLKDPTYIAAKSGIEFRQTSLPEWIAYAASEFAAVNVGDLLVKQDPNGVAGSLWGATAFLKIKDQDLEFLDQSRGRRSFAANHRFNGGRVATGWIDPDTTTEWIPADIATRAYVHNVNRCVKFTNVFV